MTQHYVGTKIVLAWPQEKDGRAGYAVKYADGYISWSPADTFEAAYIAIGHIGDLQPHEQRMVAEHAELSDKLTKLSAFLESEKFASLSEDDRRLLAVQADGMRVYHNALLVRIERIRPTNTTEG
jgi:hypothetical protein